MAKHNEVGRIGEGVAVRFLVKKRYSIIEKNYRKKWGEIDIVAKKDEKIHFVEVKTVSRENLFEERKTGHIDEYHPEDNMHPWKIKRLHRAIETYLLEKDISGEKEWQLDLVTVKLDLNQKQAKAELYENVVL